jgi:hypothetical protein
LAAQPYDFRTDVPFPFIFWAIAAQECHTYDFLSSISPCGPLGTGSGMVVEAVGFLPDDSFAGLPLLVSAAGKS